MAKIPEYQRQKLASSAVGTPGVDNSTAQALTSISQDFQTVGNRYASEAIRKANQLEAEERAIKRQQDKILQDSRINNALFEYTQVLNEARSEARTQGINNPETIPDAVDKAAGKYMDQYSKTFSDPFEQEIFKSRALGMSKQIVAGEHEYARARQISLIGERSESQLNDLAISMGESIQTADVGLNGQPVKRYRAFDEFNKEFDERAALAAAPLIASKGLDYANQKVLEAKNNAFRNLVAIKFMERDYAGVQELLSHETDFMGAKERLTIQAELNRATETMQKLDQHNKDQQYTMSFISMLKDGTNNVENLRALADQAATDGASTPVISQIVREGVTQEKGVEKRDLKTLQSDQTNLITQIDKKLQVLNKVYTGKVDKQGVSELTSGLAEATRLVADLTKLDNVLGTSEAVKFSGEIERLQANIDQAVKRKKDDPNASIADVKKLEKFNTEIQERLKSPFAANSVVSKRVINYSADYDKFVDTRTRKTSEDRAVKNRVMDRIQQILYSEEYKRATYKTTPGKAAPPKPKQYSDTEIHKLMLQFYAEERLKGAP